MQYELKSMTLGEILDMSFRLFRDNFWLLVAISGIVFFPMHFVQGLMEPSVPTQPTEAAAQFLALFLVFMITLVLVLLMGPIANAAVTKVVADRYLDRPTSFREAYGYVFRRFWKLVGALLLSSLIIIIGFVLLVVPGIIFTLRYTLVPVVVIVENKGGAEALRRSRELMKKNWLMVLVIWILVGVLSGVLSGLASLIPFTFPAALISAGVGILYATFAQVVYVVLYMHARCDKEAFDLEFLAKSLSEENSTEGVVS